MNVFRYMGVSFCSHQRLELFAVYKAEFSGKVIEMLVAGVDMSFGCHLENPVKVMNVHMHKNTEEPTHNLLADLNEVFWKRNFYERVNKEKVNKLDTCRNMQIHVCVRACARLFPGNLTYDVCTVN